MSSDICYVMHEGGAGIGDSALAIWGRPYSRGMLMHILICGGGGLLPKGGAYGTV